MVFSITYSIPPSRAVIEAHTMRSLSLDQGLRGPRRELSEQKQKGGGRQMGCGNVVHQLN